MLIVLCTSHHGHHIYVVEHRKKQVHHKESFISLFEREICMSKHDILIVFLGSVAMYGFEMQRWALLKDDEQCFLILVLENMHTDFTFFLDLTFEAGWTLRAELKINRLLRLNECEINFHHKTDNAVYNEQLHDFKMRI